MRDRSLATQIPPYRPLRRLDICTPAGRLFWLVQAGVGALFLLTGTVLAQSPNLSDLPALADMQARIVANGWSWEADDSFVRSLSPEQRANLRGFVPPPDYEKILTERLKIYPVDKDDLPSYWDWRDMDGVTPVKNQAECGSCWAFAATGEMESFVKIYYGQELDLSEQQVVSCNPYGAGCDGGWAGAAYAVFASNGAIHEHCMPYQAADPPIAPCQQAGHPPYGWVTGWHSIANNVTQIKTALLDGPVCTGVDASSEFEMYSGGCYDVPGGAWTNHLVLIVGWDDRLCDGQGAWIIKNSWGPGFGQYGYIYIKYGAGLVGSGVTQLEYTPPPVTVQVTGPTAWPPLMGEEPTQITWSTSGGPVGTVDIWFSRNNMCFETLVAADVPNTGIFDWLVPNEATTNGRLLIHPHTGTSEGYDFNDLPLTIIGHKVRYVSSAGTNTPPFETPATAAHSINAAVQACTGLDSVMISAGNYLETTTINSTVRLFGGWNADFTERDPAVHTTNLRSVQSAVRFSAGSGDFGAVDGITFHDCLAGYYADPSPGNHGGAICVMSASPTINDCIFVHNRAASGVNFGLGGAIMVVGGSPTITNCRFEDNIATHGGAIALHGVGTTTLGHNTFLRNACSDSVNGNRGAALFVSGGVVVSDSDLFRNNGGAAEGGGIFLENASLTAVDLELVGNRAMQNGGGFCSDAGQVQISHAAILDNLSGNNGGGLHSESDHIQIQNSRVVGNQSTNLGGGLMLMSAAGGGVENCLVETNTTGLMGGGVFASTSNAFNVRNNIATANTNGGLVCAGSGIVADYNDVWNNSGGDYGIGTPGEHDIAADPQYVDPAGGDYGLGLHSPCLDRGDPEASCADPDGSPADIGLLGGPQARPVAPTAVAGASISDLGDGSFTLSWTPNSELDMAEYVVYRDTAEVFTPSPATVVATLPHPTNTFQDAPPHACYYLVVSLDSDGHVGGYSTRLLTTPLTPVAEEQLPQVLAIASVVPNPFNPRTTIWYDVPHAKDVDLRVYDLRGRLVRELVRGQAEPGRHSTVWDGTDATGRLVAAGVYFVRVVMGNEAVTAKVMLAK